MAFFIGRSVARLSIFKDLWWFFKLEKKAYLIGITTLLIVSLLELFIPYAIRVMVDYGTAGKLTTAILLKWCSLILLCGVLAYACRFVWRILIYGSSIRLGKILRDRFYQYLTKQSSAFYQRHRTGDLMAHGTNDIQAVVYTAGDGVMVLVDGILGAVLILGTMWFFIDWSLTSIALLPMPFMAIAARYYGKKMHERFHYAQEAFSDMTGKVQENITSMRMVKAFGLQQKEVKNFDHVLDRVVSKNIAVARVEALYDPTIILTIGFSFLLTIVFGSWKVLQNEITLGQLTQFTMYISELIWPMLAFGYLINLVERGRASYGRLQKLFQEEKEIKEIDQGITQSPQGSIDFAIQSFRYDKEAVLQSIDLHVEKGSTLGIVGKTGSGKSTLLRLLLREFDLDDGEIRFADHELKDYSFKALRSAIGYVPQEHFLFSTTIEENIAFGKPNASLQEVQQMARSAAVHEDIERFANGYQTVVGEKGVMLSGGQKQRLSIARAMLLKPEVLLLDDALSAVDAKTEQTIINVIQRERKEQTTIIAAHRLSAVEHADQIIVLERGEIKQHGTHQQLLQQEGWYKQMYMQQNSQL